MEFILLLRLLYNLLIQEVTDTTKAENSWSFLLPRAPIQTDFASGEEKDKKCVTDTLIYFLVY